MAQPLITALDHVQVSAPAGCEAAARQFYGELLGLPEITKPTRLAANGGVWFQLGAQSLHIGVDPAFTPARRAHPALLVRDLDALAARLSAASATVQWDDRLRGYRRFYTFDPWATDWSY